MRFDLANFLVGALFGTTLSLVWFLNTLASLEVCK